MGATAEEPPPGIKTIAEVVDVDYGVTPEELREALPGSDVLFAWRPRRGPLEEAWDRAGDLRWVSPPPPAWTASCSRGSSRATSC
jgi:hypothetical protein